MNELAKKLRNHIGNKEKSPVGSGIGIKVEVKIEEMEGRIWDI